MEKSGIRMNKPIVVGINGSAGSEAALTWALERAARDKLPVTIIHAVDDRWISPDFQYHELIRQAGMDLLQKAQASAAEQVPDVTVDIQLRHGSGGSVLREVSKEASMVVVGEHDKHWMDGGPLTDRALQIVSASEIPAAVIPLTRGAGAAGVVVGVDGSEESLQAVDFAAAEADKGGDELTVVLAFRRPARWVENQLPKSGLAESILEEDRIVLAESVAGLGDKYPDLVVHQRLETDTEPAKALVDAGKGGPAPGDRQPRPRRLLPDGARLHGPRRTAQRAVPDHCHAGAQGQARGLTAGGHRESLLGRGGSPGDRTLEPVRVGWEDDAVEPFFDFVGHFWWLIFPLSGLFGGWARSWSRASERRHRRRVELYKLRNQAAEVEQASRAQVRQLMDSHDAVNRRWLDYELDVGKLIDFPVMTDVREPLTVGFPPGEAAGRRAAARKLPGTSRRRRGWRSTARPSPATNWRSTSPSGKPGGSRTATSPDRNGSASQRPGSCCGSLRTPPPHRRNGKRRTNVPGANWTD